MAAPSMEVVESATDFLKFENGLIKKTARLVTGRSFSEFNSDRPVQFS
ncbi:hypothetical protein LP420_05435 [Massilia sp. B-10]|nr:hypothetical protein LP420_05435 [Massilia sp. B-10]